ncbi:unnamed protein product [Periconia digitata]|uniref:Heterokaryon incompatibility domain-containing protein n=1 Tax=Periconia digitata TaxID=1303443 RepID=A0A9W4XE50_9PLEO|nr:unnamed protein product [Periconia digitata]
MSRLPKLYHRRDIRLIRIKPGTKQSNIEIEIETSNLDSNVEYTALSYVWGENPSLPSSIVYDGQNVPVTRNLWEVMLRFRAERLVGLLWVDAICINQQDNDEKSMQVNMMRDIYKQAAKVIFWLGEQEEYDEDAVKLIKVFNENNKRPVDRAFPSGMHSKELSDLGLPYDDPGWSGWASLLCRPWFGRVWIVQEFLNASYAVFKTGSLEIVREDLIWFAYASGVSVGLIARVGDCMNVPGNHRSTIMRAFHLAWDLLFKIEDKSLVDARMVDSKIMDMWMKSQMLGATDPRDRVSALLSTQNVISLDIVDYKKDLVEVYTEIASIALNARPLDTDSYSESSKDSGSDTSETFMISQRTSRFLGCKTTSLHKPSLPSWVPDWRPSATLIFERLTRYFVGTSRFSKPYIDAMITEKTMSISGCIIDKPAIIVDSPSYILLRSSHNKLSLIKRIINWHVACYLLTCAYYHIPKASNTTHLEEFSRVMGFSALYDGTKCPSFHYIAGFGTLHSSLIHSSLEPITYRIPIPAMISWNKDLVNSYRSIAAKLTQGRMFAITTKGDLAWVPETTKLNDSICFLAGCAVPFVVRSHIEGGDMWYELLGDCYLHGRMADGNIVLNEEPEVMVFR